MQQQQQTDNQPFQYAPQSQTEKDIYDPLRQHGNTTPTPATDRYQGFKTRLDALDTKSKIDLLNSNLTKLEKEKSELKYDINSIYGTPKEKNEKRNRVKQIEDAERWLVKQKYINLSDNLNEFSTITDTNIVGLSNEDVANTLMRDGLNYLKYANNAYYNQLNSIIKSEYKLSDYNKKKLLDMGLSAGLDALNKRTETIKKEYENDNREEYKDIYAQGLKGVESQWKSLYNKYNEYVANNLPDYKQTEDRIKQLDKQYEDSPVWESIKHGIFSTAGNAITEAIKGIAAFEVNTLSKVGLMDKGLANTLIQDAGMNTFEVSKYLTPEVLTRNPKTGESEFKLSGVLPTIIHTTVQSYLLIS